MADRNPYTLRKFRRPCKEGYERHYLTNGRVRCKKFKNKCGVGQIHKPGGRKCIDLIKYLKAIARKYRNITHRSRRILAKLKAGGGIPYKKRTKKRKPAKKGSKGKKGRKGGKKHKSKSSHHSKSKSSHHSKSGSKKSKSSSHGKKHISPIMLLPLPALPKKATSPIVVVAPPARPRRAAGHYKR